LNRTRLFILTGLTMIAFASNSLLCRVALKQTGIDAATFTLVRICSGAAALWLIMQYRRRLIVERTPSALVDSSSRWSLVTRHLPLSSGNWLSAFSLFVYAAAFSFAYNSLSAATGALLLFGAVQATMIFWGLRKGERLDPIQIVGLLAAVSGLVVLLFPGLSAPSLAGSILMLSSGVAWGIYSLRGKTANDAITTTAGNFLRAVPFAALVSLIMIPRIHFDSLGIIYAFVSGAITSGLGYAVWYSVLSASTPVRSASRTDSSRGELGLKAASAATVQLSVPVLAAGGGILLLGEPITLRYVLASISVLGGIALVVIKKR
jgi:drug/metabolite transporter (DMT)-like permease